MPPLNDPQRQVCRIVLRLRRALVRRLPSSPGRSFLAPSLLSPGGGARLWRGSQSAARAFGADHSHVPGWDDGQTAELRFAELLRQLRTEARLTQEELAEAAGLSPRSVSDLERGINRTARKDSARLLADALQLSGEVRVVFVAAARGRAPAAEVLAAQRAAATAVPIAAATRSLPRDIGGFTGREPELATAAGHAGRAGLQRAGGHLRDRRGGDRQDHVRGARGAPAGREVPGRAVLPSAARAHGRAAPGGPRGRAGQLAAHRRGPGPEASRPAWRPGPAAGGTTSRARGSCWCWTTRPGTSRSGRCSPARPAAWSW